ncbi:hypothetical protein ACGFYE_38015 [Streptomyces zaomyceticus]|uniref:hypothetical protein n=1 Tax=Streptomyces zaomyceticus TaxID=68286 RepID=UPI00371736F6
MTYDNPLPGDQNDHFGLDGSEATHNAGTSHELLANESQHEGEYLAVLSAHQYYTGLDEQADSADKSGEATEKGSGDEKGIVSAGTGRFVALVTAGVTAAVALVKKLGDIVLTLIKESAETEREKERQASMTERETLRQQAMTRRAEITGRPEESPAGDESGGGGDGRTAPAAGGGPQTPDASGG